jgi:hypothetical protein
VPSRLANCIGAAAAQERPTWGESRRTARCRPRVGHVRPADVGRRCRDHLLVRALTGSRLLGCSSTAEGPVRLEVGADRRSGRRRRRLRRLRALRVRRSRRCVRGCRRRRARNLSRRRPARMSALAFAKNIPIDARLPVPVQPRPRHPRERERGKADSATWPRDSAAVPDCAERAREKEEPDNLCARDRRGHTQQGGDHPEDGSRPFVARASLYDAIAMIASTAGPTPKNTSCTTVKPW